MIKFRQRIDWKPLKTSWKPHFGHFRDIFIKPPCSLLGVVYTGCRFRSRSGRDRGQVDFRVGNTSSRIRRCFVNCSESGAIECLAYAPRILLPKPSHYFRSKTIQVRWNSTPGWQRRGKSVRSQLKSIEWGRKLRIEVRSLWFICDLLAKLVLGSLFLGLDFWSDFLV